MKGYCVKCKTTREMKDPKKKQTKNGRWMMQGTCPECGTKVSVFIKDADAKKMKGGVEPGAPISEVSDSLLAGGNKKNNKKNKDEMKGGKKDNKENKEENKDKKKRVRKAKGGLGEGYSGQPGYETPVPPETPETPEMSQPDYSTPIPSIPEETASAMTPTSTTGGKKGGKKNNKKNNQPVQVMDGGKKTRTRKAKNDKN